jgi:hypothetical protein
MLYVVYAECHEESMLKVIMLSVVMLNVIMLSVVRQLPVENKLMSPHWHFFEGTGRQLTLLLGLHSLQIFQLKSKL